jgi:hypothetical protein
LNLFDIKQDFNKPCTCILRRKQWKEEQHKNVHIYFNFLLSSLFSFDSLWEKVQFITKAIHKHLHFRPSNLYTRHNNTLPKIQFCEAIAKLESTRLCYPNILLSRVLIHGFIFNSAWKFLMKKIKFSQASSLLCWKRREMWGTTITIKKWETNGSKCKA